MAGPRNTLTSRPIPLIGFLCLMAGGGMLYSSRGVAMLAGPSGGYVRVFTTLIGCGLMLWGVWLITMRVRSRANQRVGRLNRNRVMLPREGLMYLIVMIVAFVASLIGRSNMLMLVFSIMAGPFVVNGWVIYSLLKNNRVSRRLPRSVMAGELVSVEVTLENRKRLFSTWLMVVRDQVNRERQRRFLDGADESLEPAVLFASVRPKSSRTACYQLRLGRRGLYQFGPMEVSTRFPLGLVERGYVSDVRSELLVHPQVGQLLPAWDESPQLATDPVQRAVTRRGVFDDEFHHLRDYRAGDNPRDIHWRTSARRNGLMVREFHQSRDRGLLVLIELWQSEQPTQDELDRVELAVSFAATICVHHLKQTRGVHQTLFVAGGESARLNAETGGHMMESMLDCLAMVEAGAAESFSQLAQEAAQAANAVTRLVVITTRPRGYQSDKDSPVQALPAAEIYHATPTELARWFVPGDERPSPFDRPPTLEVSHKSREPVPS